MAQPSKVEASTVRQPRFRSGFRSRSVPVPGFRPDPFRPLSVSPFRHPSRDFRNLNLDSISELKPSESVYAHSSTTQRCRIGQRELREELGDSRERFGLAI